jgi:hypothetical protein
MHELLILLSWILEELIDIYPLATWIFGDLTGKPVSILPLTEAMGIKIIPTLLDTHPTANGHVIIQVYGGKYTAILPPTPFDWKLFWYRVVVAFLLAELIVIIAPDLADWILRFLGM